MDEVPIWMSNDELKALVVRLIPRAQELTAQARKDFAEPFEAVAAHLLTAVTIAKAVSLQPLSSLEHVLRVLIESVHAKIPDLSEKS
jgi:hypothetical protein